MVVDAKGETYAARRAGARLAGAGAVAGGAGARGFSVSQVFVSLASTKHQAMAACRAGEEEGLGRGGQVDLPGRHGEVGVQRT